MSNYCCPVKWLSLLMVIIFLAKTKITKRVDTSWEVSALIFFFAKVLPDSNISHYTREHEPSHKWVNLLAKVLMVLSKRVVDSKRKKRRCFLKESTMLRGSSQYTLRYHLTAMHREVVIRDKQSAIIVCSTWVSWSFLSVAFLSQWIHREQHNGAGRIRKRYLCFSDEIKYPYEDSCDSLSHS